VRAVLEPIMMMTVVCIAGAMAYARLWAQGGPR
jgi:hypothetical protein